MLLFMFYSNVDLFYFMGISYNTYCVSFPNKKWNYFLKFCWTACLNNSISQIYILTFQSKSDILIYEMRYVQTVFHDL